MDIKRVAEIIDHSISGGKLDLADSALESTPILAMFDAYLDGKRLLLDGVSAPVVNSTVKVKGTGANAPFEGMGVEAVFSVVNETAQVVLTATAQPGWTFAKSYPGLDQTLLPSLSFRGEHGFTLRSLEEDDEAPGLHFRGSLALGGELAVLLWLLGEQDPVDVRGRVDIDKGIPVIELAAPSAPAVRLGFFEVPYVRFVVGTAVRPALDGSGPAPIGFFRLDTEIDFVAGETQETIPISAEFDRQLQVVLFAVDLTVLGKDIESALADLWSLTGGVDFSSQLKDIPLSSLLALKALLVQVDLANRTLESVRVVVGSTESWTFFSEGDLSLTLDEVDVVLQLDAQRNPSVAIFGEVPVGRDARLQASAVYPGFAFSAELVPGTQLDLTQVIEHFLGSKHELPALRVVDLSLEVALRPARYSASLAVESDWTIPIGSTSLRVEEIAMSIDHPGPGETTAHLSGAVDFAGVYLAASWDLPGEVQLSGKVPEIRLQDVIAKLGAESLRADFPAITLLDSQVYVERRADAGYYVALGTFVEGFGALELDFLSVKGKTGWVFGFVLPETWSLADLSSELSSLSFLKFRNASLMVATVTDPNFAFRSFHDPRYSFPPRLPSAPPGAVEGLSLYAELLIEGGPLDVVADLLKGLDGLALAVTIPRNIKDTRFTAAWTKPIELIGPWVVLDRVAIGFAPGDIRFLMQTDATFTIHGHSLSLSGSMEVAVGVVTLGLRTLTPWVDPFGIKGLTIGNMGASFSLGPALTVSLAGEVTIGQGDKKFTLQAGVEFNAAEEGAPDVLLAREVGTIYLAEIIQTFTTSAVPEVLNTISLSDFQLIVVANPAGWTNPADMKHYAPGLSVGGELRFFGLDAKFAIEVDYARGIYAMGQIDKAVVIGPLTLASAADPAAGPYVQINSASSPYVQLSLALTIFEIASLRADARVANDVFHVEFTSSIPSLGDVYFLVDLQGKSSFALKAYALFELPTVGPIRAGRYTLGTWNTPIDMAASFDVSVDSTLEFHLAVSGSFRFEGRDLTFGPLGVDTSITKFAELFKIYGDQLAQILWDVGSGVLHDVGALFELIRRGALTVTDDLAKILNEELHVGLQQGVSLLRGVSATVGYDARKVAELARTGWGALDRDVAGAMRAAGYAVTDVADAVANAFHEGATAVATALRQAGYDLNAIATALNGVFHYSASQVADFFKNSWGVADSAVESALKAAGYAAGQIESAMKAVSNWVDHAVEEVKDKLDPRNW